MYFKCLNLSGRDHWKTRRRWTGTTKMDIKKIGWGKMDWIHLAQDRDQWMALVNMVKNLRVL
jgi:hypothetical protein